MNTPRLYTDLAWLWPLWGSPEDYTDYCNHVTQLIHAHAQIRVRSLLNLGCGGGKTLFNLKSNYNVTGVDLSPQMLELARDLNPDCEFIQGDMRTVRLNRTFDAVLIDDAIAYMTTQADLQSVFKTAWQHLQPGGVMVVTPDTTKETFVQNDTTVTPGTQQTTQPHLTVVFIENNYDSDLNDTHYEGTLIYLIREEGRLRLEVDCHVFGLFARDVWRQTLTDVGFKVYEEQYNEYGVEYITLVGLKILG